MNYHSKVQISNSREGSLVFQVGKSCAYDASSSRYRNWVRRYPKLPQTTLRRAPEQHRSKALTTCRCFWSNQRSTMYSPPSGHDWSPLMWICTKDHGLAYSDSSGTGSTRGRIASVVIFCPDPCSGKFLLLC